MNVVYVVHSKDTVDRAHTIIWGVYECKEEAKIEAAKCYGWVKTCEFFPKSIDG